MTEPSESILEQFDKAAGSVGLSYFLIGGFAASYWGTPRFTADVDYVISQSSFEKAVEATGKIGYNLIFKHPKQSFAHFANETKQGFRIDFMLCDKSTWQKLESDSSFAELGGSRPYPIVSPLHLIAMKLHAAKQNDRVDIYKDLNDIAEILRVQELTFDDLDKAGIIEKHGTEKTLTQLRSILESKRGS